MLCSRLPGSDRNSFVLDTARRTGERSERLSDSQCRLARDIANARCQLAVWSQRADHVTMPGTRYTSSFDSIEGWQGASLPGSLPLNGSCKNYARSASTDSLDSSGTGTTTTCSGGHRGAGHSRKVSMEGPGESTRAGARAPVVSHNPWQFVKVDPVPLCKKATAQMKMCQEVKTVQDCKKEEEELWLKKLDSWKSRRRKVTEKTIQRVEDLKLLQQEDENRTQRKSKTKTFSEIVENRAQKPRCYNLSVHGENEGHLISRVNSCKTNDRRQEGSGYLYVLEARRKSEPSVKQNDIRNQDLAEPDLQDFTFSNIKDKFEILEEDPCDNPKEDSAICMEEDCESCGRYTTDLVLDTCNCSQRDGDTRDRSSELSLDTSEDYEEHVNEYELDGHSGIDPGECSVSNTYKKLSEHPQDIQQADNNVHLSIRLRLDSGTEDKDFGFKVREEDGTFLVDELKHQGVGMRSGLRPNDRILAVNEKATSGRSRSSILFAMKQSLYSGHLDLFISRSRNKGATESGNSFSDSLGGEETFSPSLGVPSQNTIGPVVRNGEISGEVWKSNRTSGDFQSSQICKEPEPRLMKGCINSSTPPAVDNSPFAVGELASEKELRKAYSNEKFEFSSSTSVTGVPEEIGSSETKSSQFLDGRLDHTVAKKNVSQVSPASPSSVNKDPCAQLQSKGLSSTSDLDGTLQPETGKVSDDFGYCHHSVDPHRGAPSPSEGSLKQKSPSSESDATRRSCEFLDKKSSDDPTNNGEQNSVTTDTLSRRDDSERSGSLQSKQCRTDEEETELGEGPTLKGEEKLFKEREESLLRRKKEVELELRRLLWEEYKLEKEKEEYHRRVLLAQRDTHRIGISSGVKLSQV